MEQTIYKASMGKWIRFGCLFAVTAWLLLKKAFQIETGASTVFGSLPVGFLRSSKSKLRPLVDLIPRI